MDGETLLIRAHGEPPQTFALARSKGFNVIDCTCPVVVKLQERIRQAHDRLNTDGRNGQIIIFGKIGHAEVLGLVGQVDGNAIVIEDINMLEDKISDGTIDITRPTEVFSQTTKSPAEYARICSRLEELMAGAMELSVERFKGTHLLTVHNTICAQVASRHARLSKFAASSRECSPGSARLLRCRPFLPDLRETARLASAPRRAIVRPFPSGK